MSPESAGESSNSPVLGAFLIGFAALCWATDAVFRVPLLRWVSPVLIVFFEHVIGTILLGLWVVLFQKQKVRGYPFLTWLCLFLVGAGGSGLATVLFTASFKHVNPSVSILLQKLQPLLVVVFAFIFLREKPKRSFWGWAPVALLATIVVSFPDFDFSFVSHGIDWRSLGVIYALSAATLWALATVAGKAVLGKVPPSVVTFWRYVFGLIALVVLATAAGTWLPSPQTLARPAVWHSLLYIAFIPGILALVLYYNGLKRTAASKATFIELVYPVGAVALNWIFLKAALAPIQVLAGIVLLYAIARISS